MKYLKVRYDSDYGFDVTARGVLLGNGYVDEVRLYFHDDEWPNKDIIEQIKDEAAERLLEENSTPEVRF